MWDNEAPGAGCKPAPGNGLSGPESETSLETFQNHPAEGKDTTARGFRNVCEGLKLLAESLLIFIVAVCSWWAFEHLLPAIVKAIDAWTVALGKGW